MLNTLPSESKTLYPRLKKRRRKIQLLDNGTPEFYFLARISTLLEARGYSQAGGNTVTSCKCLFYRPETPSCLSNRFFTARIKKYRRRKAQLHNAEQTSALRIPNSPFKPETSRPPPQALLYSPCFSAQGHLPPVRRC